MKHLFVVNPVAGGRDRSPEIRLAAEAAFRTRKEPYEVYVTKGPMDAADKIRKEASCEEHLRVYACGGDGTFNECVCGGALLENTAVCPFPTGTGNDFCRMFGEEKELFRDLDALLSGTEHPIDLIDCNGRFSANICSVGIDARIGTDVHKYSSLPLIGGSGAYIVSTVVNVCKGINRPMRVLAGDYCAQGPHALACACNGRFYGGGFNPSRSARPDDGVLELFIVPGLSLPALAANIGKYAAGRADECPRYIRHLRGDSMQIDFEEESIVNVDGEGIRARSVCMRIVPHALRLIVPRGMHYFEDETR